MRIDWDRLSFELEQLGPDAGLPVSPLRMRASHPQFLLIKGLALPPGVWLAVLLSWVEHYEQQMGAAIPRPGQGARTDLDWRDRSRDQARVSGEPAT